MSNVTIQFDCTITFTFECSQCSKTETETHKHLGGWALTMPMLPIGWTQIHGPDSRHRLLCDGHVVVVAP
jgi:hypothetical protein